MSPASGIPRPRAGGGRGRRRSGRMVGAPWPPACAASAAPGAHAPRAARSAAAGRPRAPRPGRVPRCPWWPCSAAARPPPCTPVHPSACRSMGFLCRYVGFPPRAGGFTPGPPVPRAGGDARHRPFHVSICRSDDLTGRTRGRSPTNAPGDRPLVRVQIPANGLRSDAPRALRSRNARRPRDSARRGWW